MKLKEYQLYIDGEYVDADNNLRFNSIDPSLETEWCSVPEASERDVDKAVSAAKKAFQEWSKTDVQKRANYLRLIGDKIYEHSEHLGRIETIDSGKLLTETTFQAKYMKDYFYFYADLLMKMDDERTVPDIDKPNMIVTERYEAIGVLAFLLPFNSQSFLLTTKLAPALAAGCTCVIKSSEIAPAFLAEFSQLIDEVKLPKGVVNIVHGGISCGQSLTSHKFINKVFFTGGTNTASHIIKNSSENFAQLNLELGGKSAALIFDDCDLENTLNNIITGVYSGNGESCISSSLCLLQENIYDEFITKLIERVHKIKLGPPLETSSNMGPLAHEKQVKFIENQIKKSVEQGAKILVGGKRSENLKSSLYFEPTIIACSDRSISTSKTELFGPVLSVIKFKSEEEAISIANDSEYGLSSGVFTESHERAERVSRSIDAGICFINCYRFISPHVSFQGRKHSGYGFESGADAIQSMQVKKSIWTSTSRVTEDPFKIR